MIVNNTFALQTSSAAYGNMTKGSFLVLVFSERILCAGEIGRSGAISPVVTLHIGDQNLDASFSCEGTTNQNY